MYEYLTDEEKAQFKESLRLFRHPQFSKKSGMFYTSGISNENDNTSAGNAFTRKNTNHRLKDCSVYLKRFDKL